MNAAESNGVYGGDLLLTFVLDLLETGQVLIHLNREIGTPITKVLS